MLRGWVGDGEVDWVYAGGSGGSGGGCDLPSSDRVLRKPIGRGTMDEMRSL